MLSHGNTELYFRSQRFRALPAPVWTMLSLHSSVSGVTGDHNSSLWSTHPCIFLFFPPWKHCPFLGSKATLPCRFWCQLEQVFIPKHPTIVLYCQNILLRSWNSCCNVDLSRGIPGSWSRTLCPPLHISMAVTLSSPLAHRSERGALGAIHHAFGWRASTRNACFSL